MTRGCWPVTLAVADKPDVAALDVRRRAINLFWITYGRRWSVIIVNDSQGDLSTDNDYFNGTSIRKVYTVNQNRMLGADQVKLENW